VTARIEVRLSQRYCCSATCAFFFLDLIFVRMHEGFLCIRLTLQVCKYVIRNSMGPYPLYATWSKEPNLHFLVTTRAFGRCMVDEKQKESSSAFLTILDVQPSGLGTRWYRDAESPVGQSMNNFVQWFGVALHGAELKPES